MLGQLVRREILDHILSLRFTVLAAIGVICISWSCYDGLAHYRDRMQEYQSAREATEHRIQQILTADERITGSRNNWAEIFAIGFMVHTPPNPLTILERGMDPYQGRSMVIATSSDWWLKRSAAADETILDSFPPLDVGTVVRVLFGLFALFLSYDAFCGEKERGTLRLNISFPVPRYRLLVSKIIGTAVPLMTAYVLPLLLGCAILTALPDVHLTQSQWVRVACVIVVYAIYIGVMVCAGVLLSCLTRSPSTSLVLLLVVWVSWGVILPRIGPVLASKVTRAPSVAKLESDIRRAVDDDWAVRQGVLQEWSKDYEEETGTSPFSDPTGTRAYYLARQETQKDQWDFIESSGRQLRERFRNDHREWMDTASWISRLSPSFVAGIAAVNLTGTGVDRFRRLQDDMLAYFQLAQVWIHDTWYVYQFSQLESGLLPDWDLRDLPRFQPVDRWPSSDVLGTLVDVSLLCAWGLLLFAAAVTATLRYDCR